MFLEINISNFGSYFALFAGLNLGYASSQSFRDAIDSGILKIGEKTVNSKILKLKTRYRALIQTARQNHKDYEIVRETGESKAEGLDKEPKKFVEINPEISFQLRPIVSSDNVRKSDEHIQAEENLAKINILNSNFKKAILLLDQEREAAANFVEGFKSMFLIAGLYCMTFLVLAGLQNEEYNFYYYNVINFLTVFTLPFNIFVFFRSNGVNFDKKITPIIVVLMFFSIVVITILFNCFSVAVLIGRYLPLELCLAFACIVAIHLMYYILSRLIIIANTLNQ